MKDFGKWMAEQRAINAPTKEIPDELCEELPEGLYLEGDGNIVAYCRSCGMKYDWPCDPEEGYDHSMSYCGRSDRCCP